MNRGYETHVRVLLEHLRSDASLDMSVVLFKGDGAGSPAEVALSTPCRDGALCKLLARFRGDPLYWEYTLFAVAFVMRSILLQDRYDTVACIEPMVAKTLCRLRRLLPGRPRLTFTHGVSMEPRNYCSLGDVVHEVNVESYERAQAHLMAGGNADKVVCIPHFIARNDGSGSSPVPDRASLGIGTRFVVLAVGVIDSNQKRTDHVIREVSKLGPDWTLLACGLPSGDGGQEVLALGRELLGARFVNISLPRDEIWKAYAVADVFVLGSLNEGFGLVLLEAMRAGLPIFAHDRPLFRWILGESGSCVRMDVPGALADRLRHFAANPAEAREAGSRLKERFRMNFTWDSVRDEYVRMLTGRSPSRQPRG